MIQLVLGLVMGLVLVAFFIAIMYYVLPDEAVDKALSRFRGMFNDLLGSTIGRVLDMLFSPVVALTQVLVNMVVSIGQRAGPLAGFSVALLGLLWTSWGIMAIISPEKATTSTEGMYKATIALVALMALGAITWVTYQGLKHLFRLPMALVRAKRRRPRPKARPRLNRDKAIRLGYVLVVILIVMFGIHVAHMAVEVVWPNSNTAKILEELDLMEKFYLHVIQDVDITRHG